MIPWKFWEFIVYSRHVTKSRIFKNLNLRKKADRKFRDNLHENNFRHLKLYSNSLSWLTRSRCHMGTSWKTKSWSSHYWLDTSIATNLPLPGLKKKHFSYKAKNVFISYFKNWRTLHSFWIRYMLFKVKKRLKIRALSQRQKNIYIDQWLGKWYFTLGRIQAKRGLDWQVWFVSYCK